MNQFAYSTSINVASFAHNPIFTTAFICWNCKNGDNEHICAKCKKENTRAPVVTMIAATLQTTHSEVQKHIGAAYIDS
jgi:hypothetical protein